MLSKYHVTFSVPMRRHSVSHEYRTDDPVACEDLLVEVLERGYRVEHLMHEGVEMPQTQRDRMLRSAACILAAKHLERSLGLDEAEVRHRFGLPG